MIRLKAPEQLQKRLCGEIVWSRINFHVKKSQPPFNYVLIGNSSKLNQCTVSGSIPSSSFPHVKESSERTRPSTDELWLLWDKGKKWPFKLRYMI